MNELAALFQLDWLSVLDIIGADLFVVLYLMRGIRPSRSCAA
jgi:hypothetical protein